MAERPDPDERFTLAPEEAEDVLRRLLHAEDPDGSEEDEDS